MVEASKTDTEITEIKKYLKVYAWVRPFCDVWSGRRDSNSRLFAWEANILPLNYSRM
jgi:hypothetical protein